MLSRYLLLLAAVPLASCFMSAPPLKSAAVRSLSPGLSQRPKTSFSPQMATFTYTATIAKPEILQEAASKFLNDKDAKFTPTSGGVNNWVQYVDTSDGKRYVLRVYNNGCRTDRVEFEHRVLKLLEPYDLSFQLPRYMPSLAEGKTHVPLSNGNEACMSQLIPGALPKSAKPEVIGLAAGELMAAMGKVDFTGMKSPTNPYAQIYDAHHAVNREKFYEYLKKPVFDEVKEPMKILIEEIMRLEKFVEGALKLDLPRQLIHGDLHFDNVLYDGEKVTGLLDFEFCVIDWRACELAVCLSKYAAEKDPMNLFDSFSSGFGKYGQLSRKEVECIPEMVNLRIINNVVYFVGRAIAEEDDISALTTRAAMYASRCIWVRDNREAIVKIIDGHMRTHNPNYA